MSSRGFEINPEFFITVYRSEIVVIISEFPGLRAGLLKATINVFSSIETLGSGGDGLYSPHNNPATEFLLYKTANGDLYVVADGASNHDGSKTGGDVVRLIDERLRQEAEKIVSTNDHSHTRYHHRSCRFSIFVGRFARRWSH